MASGFFDLVKPELPNSVANKAPELMLEASRIGLQSAAQFAQMKRNSEEEMMKLAVNERLADDAHDLKSRELDLEADLLPSKKLYYQSVASNRATAANMAIDFNLQREAMVSEVNDQAAELQLNDPAFVTKEPVKFAANVLKFEDSWKLSPLPEVRNAIKQYREMADEQKISIKVGATFDPIAGTWSGGETKTVPIWQVVKNLQQPEVREQTLDALRAGGHIKTEEVTEEVPGTATKSWTRPIDSIWDAVIGPSETKRTVRKDTPNPQVESLLKQSESVKFERAPSKVPPAMLPKSAGKGTAPTELPLDIPGDTTTDPQASAQPVFEPTEKDKIIAQAKAAHARGAPMAALAERLQGMGIDPSELWAS